MKARQYSKLLAICVFVGISSCKAVSEKSDKLGTAKHLLNAGKYEETIGLLHEDSQQPSASAELRILMASAYAGSVGLNLVDSYPAFEELLFKDALAQKTMSLAESTNTTSTETPVPTEPIATREKAEQELLHMVSTLVTTTKVVFGLKWIPPEKRARVFSAAKELDTIPKSDAHFRAGAVYRLIIFSALFMSTFRDSLGTPNKAFTAPLEVFCAMDANKLTENVGRMHLQLKLIDQASRDLTEGTTQNPAPIKKLVLVFERIRNFFNSNRDHMTTAYFAQGALRNEVCQ